MTLITTSLLSLNEGHGSQPERLGRILGLQSEQALRKPQAQLDLCTKTMGFKPQAQLDLCAKYDETF